MMMVLIDCAVVVWWGCSKGEKRIDKLATHMFVCLAWGCAGYLFVVAVIIKYIILSSSHSVSHYLL